MEDAKFIVRFDYTMCLIYPIVYLGQCYSIYSNKKIIEKFY